MLQLELQGVTEADNARDHEEGHVECTVEATNETVDLFVFAGRDATFELYEDDGLDNSYETGEFSIIPVHRDDYRGEIQLGRRHGGFAGMRTVRRLVVRRVGPGVTPMTQSEGVVIVYSGEPIRQALA